MTYRDDASHAVQPDAIHDVPDMSVEILSPWNLKHDLIRKKALCEKFGVKEYWAAIDPGTGESFVFILKEGQYPAPKKLTGKIKSALLRHEFAF